MKEFVLLSTASKNRMKKIPTGLKVMTILASMQISWNMKNLMLL